MNLPSFDKTTLKGTASAADGRLSVHLTGNAEAPVQDALSQFIVAVHQASLDAKTSHVDVDLKGLKFMTSSCFKVFVTWLNQVRELPPEEHYRVRFLPDPTLHWQKRSLAALAAFGGDRVEIAS